MLANDRYLEGLVMISPMASTHTILRYSKRVLSLLALVAFAFASAAAPAQAGDPGSAPAADFDNDGLTNGFELSRPDLGLDPMHANLVLVISKLPGVTAEMVDPDLARVVTFFARMPNRNPDGTTGIHVTVTAGNDIPAPDVGRSYPELREIGLPRAMRGIGHGLMLGAGYGQGGQDSGLSDWSSPSRDWWTIVHELGHQLGLGHEPPGGMPSPLYASVMNYDYTFQLGGDPNAVQFSPGKLATARLDERNLNEVLPFPIADLQFLSAAPYNFTLASAGSRRTMVDFNRNSVNGEASVAADINGGTGLTPRDFRNLGKTAGGLALATFGDRLVMVYADLPPPVDWDTYAQPGLSISNPGRLRYQVLSGDTISGARSLASTATGEPHAIEAFGQFFVVHPTARGYTVISYRSLSSVGQLMPGGFAIEAGAPGTQAVLVRTTSPTEGLYLLVWDSASKAVSWRRVNAAPGSFTISLGPVNELRGSDTGSTTSLSPVRSDTPIAATWDSRVQRIALVTTQSSAGVSRLKLSQLGRYGDGWYGQRSRWFMGAGADPVASRSRPTIVHDPSLRLGNFGQYLIYTLDVPGGTDGLGTISLYRFVPGVTDIWTRQLMLNIWTTSRTAPAATLFRGNVAWGWHVNENFPGDGKNLFQVFLRSNGITDTGITDFDDVTFIATRGLKESLRNAAR